MNDNKSEPHTTDPALDFKSAATRPSYAALLSRIFSDDIACCQTCGGALRFIACIDEPNAINKILRHLNLPTEVPKMAPARDPPQETWW